MGVVAAGTGAVVGTGVAVFVGRAVQASVGNLVVVFAGKVVELSVGKAVVALPDKVVAVADIVVGMVVVGHTVQALVGEDLGGRVDHSAKRRGII